MFSSGWIKQHFSCYGKKDDNITNLSWLYFRIFSPFLHDAHSDHFFTTYALNHILKTFRYPFVRECYQYETLSETNQSYVKRKVFTPNVYFNITNQLKDKLKLAKIYKSEFKKHPFPRSLESIKALAVLRGSESGYKYAESFQLILKKND